MKNDERLHIRLPKSLKKELEAKCEREALSMNKFLVKLIKEAVGMKLLNWEDLKVEVANKYEVVVTDENLILEDEDFVNLHLEGEVVTVAQDIRNDGASDGYVLIDN